MIKNSKAFISHPLCQSCPSSFDNSFLVFPPCLPANTLLSFLYSLLLVILFLPPIPVTLPFPVFSALPHTPTCCIFFFFSFLLLFFLLVFLLLCMLFWPPSLSSQSFSSPLSFSFTSKILFALFPDLKLSPHCFYAGNCKPAPSVIEIAARLWRIPVPVVRWISEG